MMMIILKMIVITLKPTKEPFTNPDFKRTEPKSNPKTRYNGTETEILSFKN